MVQFRGRLRLAAEPLQLLRIEQHLHGKQLQRDGSAAAGCPPKRRKRFWDCLFLDLTQIGEFLAFVKAHASRPWVYPMCAAAAHTGARRSELVRLHVDDIDSGTRRC